MFVKALQEWNHHVPKEEMRRILVGDILNIQDSVAKYMIKEEWAVKA